MSSPGPTNDPLLGQIVDGRYSIRRVIGRGGMGVVYEAEATRLGRRLCALKVLLPEFTRSETAVARFTREAELAGRVKHPNVVEIFDTGTTVDGRGYIAMELLHGESLDCTLRRDGPLPWARVQHIMIQICNALTAAHGEKIVHRDMKPENCFRVERDGDRDFIKVLDFGIAKLTDPEGNTTPRLTATHAIIGTFSYMAHEQVRGEEIDHRVDVWALGVMLYEMLTGYLPFRGSNQGQIWTAISSYDPEPMQNIAPDATIPAAAEAIMRRALARPRDERFPTVEALSRAVAEVHTDGVVRPLTKHFSPPNPPTEHGASPTFVNGPTAAALAPPPPISRGHSVSPDGLTEPDPTGFVVTAAPLPTTRLASASKSTNSPLPSRSRRRAVVTIVGLGLTIASLAIWLIQSTGDTSDKPLATLGESEIQAGIAGIDLTKCSELGIPGTTLHVEVAVSVEGKVIEASLPKSIRGSELADCIERAVRRAQFPALIEMQRVSLPLSI
jgi:serine/threonine protein kinase